MQLIVVARGTGQPQPVPFPTTFFDAGFGDSNRKPVGILNRVDNTRGEAKLTDNPFQSEQFGRVHCFQMQVQIIRNRCRSLCRVVILQTVRLRPALIQVDHSVLRPNELAARHHHEQTQQHQALTKRTGESSSHILSQVKITGIPKEKSAITQTRCYNS